MATTFSESKVGRNMRIGVLGLTSCLMLLSLQKTTAFQFTVGGAKGWTVPDNSSSLNYNSWAESNRFSVRDSIMFVYDEAHDSVLEVSKADYDSCTTSSPIGTYTDGHTVFTFNHSGAHYFISGNKDHCLKNQKVVIVVLADRSKPAASPPSPSTTPSPAPTTYYSPPAVQLTPASPPEGDSKHTNAASSSMTATAAGVVGAFLTSSMVLTF